LGYRANVPGGTAIAALLAMLAQPAPPVASPPAPTSHAPASMEATPVEPPASTDAPVPATAPAPASAQGPVYAPLWSTAPPPEPAPAPVGPRQSGTAMLICGGLMAGGFAAGIPYAVGVFRDDAVCECTGDGGFCGCGLGSLAVSPILLFAAAPTLPLLWAGAWRRGQWDEWRGLAAPKRLRALGFSIVGLGVAFAVAGGVTLSQTSPESRAGTVTGSALIGGAYAATAAGGGVLLYTSGREWGRVRMKLTAGGGLTLWF
jgi:hypothetical protein